MSEQDNTNSLAESVAHCEDRIREDGNLKGVEKTLRDLEESSSFLQKLFSSETKEGIQRAKEVVELVRGNIKYHVENHLEMFETMDSEENRKTIDTLDSYFLFGRGSISNPDEKLEIREPASSVWRDLTSWKDYKHNSSCSYRNLKLYDIGGERASALPTYHYNAKEIYTILQALNATGSAEEVNLSFWDGSKPYETKGGNKTYEDAITLERTGEGKKGFWQASYTYLDRNTGIQTRLHYSRGPGKYGLRKLELSAIKPAMKF
jgi:hypothetical protein